MDELGKLLPRFLNRHVRGENAPVLEVLASLWPSVAGRAMAEQSRPVAFGNGILTLAASSAPWVTELGGLHDEIRVAVNRTLGRPLVKRVRVRLGSVPGSGDGHHPSGASGLDTGTPSAKQPVDLIGMYGKPLASIAGENKLGFEAGLDPEIREILLRSFAKYFGRTNERMN